MYVVFQPRRETKYVRINFGVGAVRSFGQSAGVSRERLKVEQKI